MTPRRARPADAAQPAPVDKHAAIVVNPIKVDADELVRLVREASAAAGWREPLVFETTVDDPGRGVATEAMEQGASLIFAAGGDGTVRDVAAALRGHDVPMVIVPRGTGNLLARNLSIPLNDLQAAVAVGFAGRAFPIDVGIAAVVTEEEEEQEHAFVVMAGIGMDADMIANADPTLKKKLGWLAYVDSGVRAIPKLGRFRIGYRFRDGADEHHAHVSSVLIGNCGTLPGSILLFPEAEVDDGIFDIAILQPKSVFGWFDIARRVTWENRVLRRFEVGRRVIRLTREASPTTMSTFRETTMTLTLEEPRVFELDGDEISVVSTISTRIDPRSLTVMVPGRN